MPSLSGVNAQTESSLLNPTYTVPLSAVRVYALIKPQGEFRFSGRMLVPFR